MRKGGSVKDEEALVPMGLVYDSLEPDKQAEILGIEQEITEKLTNIKADAYAIGKLLTKAKEILPHGQYEPWVKQTFGKELGLSTAAHLKGIYETFKDRPDIVKLLPITFLQHVSERTFPDELMELLRSNPKAVAATGTKELSQAYRDFKTGKIALDKCLALANKQVEIGLSILKGESLERHSHQAKRVAKLGFQSLQTQAQKMRQRIKKMLELHPPAVNDQPALAGISERALIADIDSCIGELTKLKAIITKGHEPGEVARVVKPRLQEKGGLVFNTWV